MATHAILWRRLDLPGHESARVLRDGGGWRLEGTAVLGHEGRPCRLDYRVECDAGWRTRAAFVDGWVGAEAVRIELAADGEGRWRLDGEERPEVEGCTDVDFGFSPSTNLLPIRRLGLAVGEEAPVRAAWLRFPGFALETLPQVYRRTGELHYRYESAGGAFVRDLTVDEAGLVTLYPGLWEVV
ncbi:MAG TPA: putative glycolipid-binding domain-containing protein [Longimicrobiaceae bacterium]|nr:putative glycolipid-binding domain-containing protein [Longimicrobiaceae bacterium]